jgi:hypothetical protein
MEDTDHIRNYTFWFEAECPGCGLIVKQKASGVVRSHAWINGCQTIRAGSQ